MWPAKPYAEMVWMRKSCERKSFIFSNNIHYIKSLFSVDSSKVKCSLHSPRCHAAAGLHQMLVHVVPEVPKQGDLLVQGLGELGECVVVLGQVALDVVEVLVV